MKNEKEHINDDLLMAYLLGEVNVMQIFEIELWINNSQENKVHFQEIEKIWLKTGKLSPKPVFVDVDKAWNKISNKIDEKKTINFNSRRKTVMQFSFGIAASLIIILGIFFIYKFNIQEVEMLTLVNTKNILTDTISDGTIISLNKNSKLTYPEKFSGDERRIKLEGEAFFDVKRNDEKPFIIETNEGYIQVLGTSFNVRTDTISKEVIVYVKTGKVRLYFVDNKNDTSDVYLTAGEKGILNKQKRKAAKDTFSNTKEQANEIFWVNKTLIFDDTKLSDVINILEKKYKVNIEIYNADLNNEILNTSFEDETIEQILEIISITFNASFSKENNTFILKNENN